MQRREKGEQPAKVLRFEQKKQRYCVEMITSADPNLAYDPVAGQKHLIRVFQIETPPMLQVQERHMERRLWQREEPPTGRLELWQKS
jgi:hypothetical protein